MALDDQQVQTVIDEIIAILKQAGCTFSEAQQILSKLRDALQYSVGGKAL